MKRCYHLIDFSRFFCNNLVNFFFENKIQENTGCAQKHPDYSKSHQNYKIAIKLKIRTKHSIIYVTFRKVQHTIVF